MGLKSYIFLIFFILLIVNDSQSRKCKNRRSRHRCKSHVKYVNTTGVVYITGKTVSGNITFAHDHDSDEDDHKILIKGTLHGLPKGLYGFHIHEKGDIINGDCMRTGPHYNPFTMEHGAPNDTIRHIGDLGNIEFNEYSVAEIDTFDNKISLLGPFSIIGRAVVIHERADDLGKGGKPDSLTTGNAGARVGCGVIGIS